MKKYITTWLEVPFDNNTKTPLYKDFEPPIPNDFGSWKLISQSSVDSSTGVYNFNIIYFTFENIEYKKDLYSEDDD